MSSHSLARNMDTFKYRERRTELFLIGCTLNDKDTEGKELPICQSTKYSNWRRLVFDGPQGTETRLMPTLEEVCVFPPECVYIYSIIQK
mmetsp:Transcript_7161/g.16796  ORF Transcript_7161/g.16796 Transcript_7161/m.16796 type:complete len:89 (-) Transcript_7161:28-294(-)